MPTLSAALRIMDEAPQPAQLSPRSLVDRCDNWGDVMRWKVRASVSINGGGPQRAPVKVYYARIGGLESQYRSPQSQHWHYGSAPTAAPDPDQADAAVIERAVCALPIYPHAVLRYHHVNLLAPPIVLRLAAKAGDEPRSRGNAEVTLRTALDCAYGLLAHALTLPAVIQRQRALDRVEAILAGFKGLPQCD